MLSEEFQTWLNQAQKRRPLKHMQTLVKHEESSPAQSALFASVSSIKTQTPARDDEYPGDSSSAQISTTVTTVKRWR